MAGDVVDRFVELWNAGAIDDLRALMADGYSHREPLYPGPYPADEHVRLMREVFERAPDRRLENVQRFPGAGSEALTGDWIGTIDGSELRMHCIFVFDVNEDATLIQRMRVFYSFG